MTAGPLGLRPGVTVLGNLAIDRVDGRPPTVGGGPAFAGAVLDAFDGGRVVTRVAEADLPFFADVIEGSGVPVDHLPAAVTSAFGLHYEGDARTLTVDAVGPVWGAADVQAAGIDTTWVHVAPLLRTDFPSPTLAALVRAGHRVSYDGQGLVRRAIEGPLQTDGAYDALLLASLSVLKLADDEVDALGLAPFGGEAARRLGVPEILVTYGSRGCDVFVGGEREHVPAPHRVLGVHATGAGDTFTVAYVAARARGDAPLEAARVASQLVVELLEVRREAGG